ncbi:IS66 family insertion sequence element accessory protein TnpB [Archangium violaceum]|uniref:IS66 family insertion sequence element accessory protein TnpB n=1 Tax=Archangium violaceum TaxID=83451 RepID=UPI003D2D160E
MRKSFDGLSLLARQVLREDPLSGHFFVFFNRTRDMVKVLWWHSGGFCLFSKRLEKGSFRLPRQLPEEAGAVTLEAVELTLLLGGIDLKASVRRPRWQPPTSGVTCVRKPLALRGRAMAHVSRHERPGLRQEEDGRARRGGAAAHAAGRGPGRAGH